MSREVAAAVEVDACWDEPCAVAVAVAVAVCVVGALCVTTCVCPDPPTWAGLVGAAVWICPARCVTVCEFVAAAVAAVALELLDGMGTPGIQVWINVPTVPG